MAVFLFRARRTTTGMLFFRLLTLLLSCDFLFENDESIGSIWKVAGVSGFREQSWPSSAYLLRFHGETHSSK
jgi:hypothetical protein